MTKVCTILVGVPASGKSTWIDQDFDDDTWILSTDTVITEIAEQYGLTYNEGFKDLIGFAEKVMWNDLNLAANEGDRIYIDRTNLTAKGRKRFIDKLKPFGYSFEAIVFPEPGSDALPIEEWHRRLDSREGKTIPEQALTSMLNSYEIPLKSEGFSDIIFIS